MHQIHLNKELPLLSRHNAAFSVVFFPQIGRCLLHSALIAGSGFCVEQHADAANHRCRCIQETQRVIKSKMKRERSGKPGVQMAEIASASSLNLINCFDSG